MTILIAIPAIVIAAAGVVASLLLFLEAPPEPVVEPPINADVPLMVELTGRGFLTDAYHCGRREGLLCFEDGDERACKLGCHSGR